MSDVFSLRRDKVHGQKIVFSEKRISRAMTRPTWIISLHHLGMFFAGLKCLKIQLNKSSSERFKSPHWMIVLPRGKREKMIIDWQVIDGALGKGTTGDKSGRGPLREIHAISRNKNLFLWIKLFSHIARSEIRFWNWANVESLISHVHCVLFAFLPHSE